MMPQQPPSLLAPVDHDYRDVLIRHLRVVHAITSRPRPKGRPKKSGPKVRKPTPEDASGASQAINNDHNATRNGNPPEDIHNAEEIDVTSTPLLTTESSQHPSLSQPGHSVGNTWPMTGNVDATLMNNGLHNTNGFSFFATNPAALDSGLSLDCE